MPPIDMNHRAPSARMYSPDDERAVRRPQISEQAHTRSLPASPYTQEHTKSPIKPNTTSTPLGLDYLLSSEDENSDEERDAPMIEESRSLQEQKRRRDAGIQQIKRAIESGLHMEADWKSRQRELHVTDKEHACMLQESRELMARLRGSAGLAQQATISSSQIDRGTQTSPGHVPDSRKRIEPQPKVSEMSISRCSTSDEVYDSTESANGDYLDDAEDQGYSGPEETVDHFFDEDDEEDDEEDDGDYELHLQNNVGMCNTHKKNTRKQYNFHCNKCDMGFEEEVNFQTHQRKEPCCYCFQCGKTMSSPRGLAQHRTRSHKPKILKKRSAPHDYEERKFPQKRRWGQSTHTSSNASKLTSSRETQQKKKTTQQPRDVQTRPKVMSFL